MNKKLVRGTLAGVAVVALATGGGTFAAWSDFASIDGNQSGADQLALDLDPTGRFGFDDVKLAPGQRNEVTKMLVNRTGTTIPAASLTLTMTDLVGNEDGCTSLNSEKAVDADCADTTSPGEFVEDAIVSLSSGAPVNGACLGGSTRTSIFDNRSLNAVAGMGAVDLVPGAATSLAPGDAVCVTMGIRLPESVDNASQGDSASFNLDFLLEQVV